MARVLIAVEVRLFREGLTEILGRGGELVVVATASSSSEALERAGEAQPDVVLVDARMAESLACVRTMSRLCPHAKVIVLGVGDLESDVLTCAEAGVAGFVPVEASLGDLVATVEGVARGEFACSARIAGVLLRHVGNLALARTPPRALPALTARELEVLRLLDGRCTNKQIARQLGIEVATVKNHVHRLLEKLQVHRRMDAVATVKGRLGT